MASAPAPRTIEEVLARFRLDEVLGRFGLGGHEHLHTLIERTRDTPTLEDGTPTPFLSVDWGGKVCLRCRHPRVETRPITPLTPYALYWSTTIPAARRQLLLKIHIGCLRPDEFAYLQLRCPEIVEELWGGRSPRPDATLATLHDAWPSTEGEV